MIARGPYTTTRLSHGGQALVDATGKVFAVIPCVHLTPEMGEETAELLAASFDMIGTLETLVGSLDEGIPKADIINYINTQVRAVVDCARRARPTPHPRYD